MSKTVTGRIYLFPVPMGDTPPAEVLPARNIELLGAVRHFVVENIRSARRFLRAADREFPIDECSFVELSEHTPASAVADMLQPAVEGHDIGVISEAGCPAVADPGADLVAAAQSAGLEVVPPVGPSSIIMSLMGSGFNGQSFAFDGYLPVDTEQRRTRLRSLERDMRSTGRTHIFIETPYRNNRMMADIMASLSRHTRVCVAADITGPRQMVRTLTVGDWTRLHPELDKIPTIFLIGN